MSTALVPLQDMERMAQAIAASNLFGMKTKDQALALMIVAQSENRHPGSIAAEYHIIQGRPSLRADAMLARFQQAGGSIQWLNYTDDKVSAEFSHPQGGKVVIEWTMDMARKAGLIGKDNWKNYPRQMLRARVVSEGVRTCYPAVCVGVYTPEEVQDFEPAKRPYTKREKDMGKAEVVKEEDWTTGIPTESAASTGTHPPDAPQETSRKEDRPTAGSVASPAVAAPKFINADQAIALEDRCKEVGVTVAAFCKQAKIDRISQLLASRYDGALAWLDAHDKALQQ